MTTLLQRIQENDLASLSDWEVAERLNTPDPTLPTAYGSVSNTEIKSILVAYELWQNIAKKAQQALLGEGESTTEETLCFNIASALEDADFTLNLKEDYIRTSFETWLPSAVQLNVIPANVATLISSKAYRYQSWAEYNNIQVTARTVGIARGGQA